MLFLDGDMELCRDWLAPAMNLLDHSPESGGSHGCRGERLPKWRDRCVWFTPQKT